MKLTCQFALNKRAVSYHCDVFIPASLYEARLQWLPFQQTKLYLHVNIVCQNMSVNLQQEQRMFVFVELRFQTILLDNVYHFATLFFAHELCNAIGMLMECVKGFQEIRAPSEGRYIRYREPLFRE